MEDLGPTHRWVADPSSAGHAATALLIQELRRGLVFLFGAILVVWLAVLLLAVGRTEQDHDPLLALLFSLALIGFLVACAVGFSHWQRLRVMRAQLPPGLELTTRFGPDRLVLRRPWAEATMHFDGYAAVEVVHGWVLLRRRENRVQVMIPVQLFPDADLARLRMTIAGYQPREPEPGPEAEPEAGPEADDS